MKIRKQFAVRRGHDCGHMNAVVSFAVSRPAQNMNMKFPTLLLINKQTLSINIKPVRVTEIDIELAFHTYSKYRKEWCFQSLPQTTKSFTFSFSNSFTCQRVPLKKFDWLTLNSQHLAGN